MRCASQQKKGVRVVRLTHAVLVATVAASAIGAAARAQSLSLAPAVGHPGINVGVSGAGFGKSEAVDVYIDTVDSALLVSSATGGLSGAVVMPASAAPGPHSITAIGRHSGVAAQSPFTVATYWAEYGFGAAHSGWNPYENSLTTATVASLGQLWSSPQGTNGATPAVVGDTMFVGTVGNGIEALSTSTGAVVWNKVPTEVFYGSPAVDGANLYIGASSGVVYALTTLKGNTKWTRAFTTSFTASPVVQGGVVYIGAENGVFYALQEATGAVLWSYTTGGDIDGSAAVANGMVYFGSGDGNIYALNAATGATIWSYNTGTRVESTPAVVNNVVYIGSDNDLVYALDATAGSLRWSYTTGGSVYANPAVASGTVYVGSADDHMYALDARTGGLRWSLVTGGLVRSASVAAGVVYFTSSDATFYAVAASSGGVLASAATGPTYFGAPAVADGQVYVSGYSNRLFAFAFQAGVDALHARRQAGAPNPASLRPDLTLSVSR
jgi:outer membrane protein assembly factor BamB